MLWWPTRPFTTVPATWHGVRRLWEGGPDQQPSKWKGQENGEHPGERLRVDWDRGKKAARKVGEHLMCPTCTYLTFH